MRRLLIVVTAIVLIAAVAVGVFLANLRRLVLGRLQATFPQFEISIEEVSLRSLSRLRITGVRLSGKRGEEGSAVSLPRTDVRFRLNPFKGLVLESVELQGARAFLLPGVGAMISSLPEGIGEQPDESKTKGTFPKGPSIGRISLRNSRVTLRAPGFEIVCSLDALAESSSTGILLEDTDLSARARIVSLTTPALRLKNLNAGLSLVVDRANRGRRIDVSRGGLNVGGFVHSDFQGYLSLAGKGLAAEGVLNLDRLQFADVLPHLKESFPELDRYRIEGETSGRLLAQYTSLGKGTLRLSGELSLRQGRTAIPLPERLVAEGVTADLPFEYTLRGGEAALFIRPWQPQRSETTVSAARITYGDQEMASDLSAAFELQDEIVDALHTSFSSHGGRVNVRLSPFRYGDDPVKLEGNLDVEDVEIDRVFRGLGLEKYPATGYASGEARLVFLAGSERPVTLGGEVSFTAPNVVVYLQKPLAISGLEVDAPFEYSAGADVQTFGIKRSETHPSGGEIAAARITYGEKTPGAATSGTQWTFSALSATAASADTGIEVTINSCRAYGGHVTGSVTVLLEKGLVDYEGNLYAENLDLATLARALGAKEGKLEVEGRAKGTLTFSRKAGAWDKVKGEFSSMPPGGVVRVEGETEVPYKLVKATVLYPPAEPRPRGGTGPDVGLHFEGTGTGEQVEVMFDSLGAGEAILQSLKKQYTVDQWNTLVRDWEITVTIPITVAKKPSPAGPIR